MSSFFKKIQLKVGQEVDLKIGRNSPLGINVIVNDYYDGLLYHNEIFKPLKEGDHVKGYVKKLREDNKVDVALEPFGQRKVEEHSEKILQYLKEHDGVLSLTDKSDPNEIRERMHMSKKVFRKAVGMLYKQKLIRIEEDGIYLNT